MSELQWKKVAVHDENNIKGFFGNFRFLSNFHVCAIEYEGLIYPSTENAYQASKVIPADRRMLTTCTPADSKKVWKMCRPLDKTPEEWDSRKLKVMTWVTLEKYNKHPELRQRLLDTGDRFIEETNWWRDKFWGVDINIGGENNLGKLLMKVRTYWQIKAL